jgi:hypothetical protein
MDCFGCLPSLLIGSDLLYFGACDVEEGTQNLELSRAQVRTQLKVLTIYYQ